MALVGGLRDRMVLESVLRQIEAALGALGWFDAGRQHLPITVIDEYPDIDVQVPLNTLAFSYGDSFNRLVELGALTTYHHAPIFIDFFAESDALSRHVSGDIYAWVNENPVIPVYDYDLATPVIDFYVEVLEESVEVQRPARATNPWLKHWSTVVFIVGDQRSNA